MKKILISFVVVILLIFAFIYRVYSKFDVIEMQKDIEKRYSQVVLDDKDGLLGAYLNKDEQWQIKSEDDIPKRLKLAVLTFEDKDFYQHSGIDIKAILRAIKTNVTTSKRVGASTITMQVAKLYKNRPRDYKSKILEMIEAKKIDDNMSKDEILKTYLNNAPYGGNIVGYKTASLLYFKKEPINLTWAEGALLAVLPNSPGLMHIEKNREKLLNKRNQLLKKMYDDKILTKSQYNLSLKEKLPIKRYYFDMAAPHLTRRLKLEYPNNTIIKSTINRELQDKIEKIVKNYGEHLDNKGIKNACAIIIDNKSGEVKAYVGSQDFYDFSRNGQVDGISSYRSVGSVLKPFLYALAIDEGLIVSKSKLLDIPLYFSNFNPQNANKKYRGFVEAKEALQKSLNIPFVNLLNEYGEDRFFFFLKNVVGFKDSDYSKYGLSLILGTKEMKVEDIAKLYYGLSQYGDFKDISYIKNDKKFKENQLISKGASYITLKELKEVQRFGIENIYTGRDNISWKTGTSYGQRDAWAAGVSPNWTVVAWCGNFTGEGNPNLSGVGSAGILMFNIFKVLPNNNDEFLKPEKSLKTVEIDKQTGYRVKYDVPKEEVDIPIDAKPLKISPYYKKIFVDVDGNEVDSRSENFANSKEKIVLSYPVELLNYLAKENINISGLIDKNNSLKIIYPLNLLKIQVPKDFDGKKNLIVKISNPNNYQIFWYVNGKYITTSKEKEKSFDFSNGEQIVSIVAENGETAQVKFEVVERK